MLSNQATIHDIYSNNSKSAQQAALDTGRSAADTHQPLGQVLARMVAEAEVEAEELVVMKRAMAQSDSAMVGSTPMRSTDLSNTRTRRTAPRAPLSREERKRSRCFPWVYGV